MSFPVNFPIFRKRFPSHLRPRAPYAFVNGSLNALGSKLTMQEAATGFDAGEAIKGSDLNGISIGFHT
jgi:hypothetical protein